VPSDERRGTRFSGPHDRSLRLPTVKRVGPRLAEEATRRRQTHLDYLAAVLLCEVDDRDERRRLRRVKAAGFPRTKLLADFDLGQSASVDPATVATLEGGGYLERGEPVVLLGIRAPARVTC